MKKTVLLILLAGLPGLLFSQEENPEKLKKTDSIKSSIEVDASGGFSSSEGLPGLFLTCSAGFKVVYKNTCFTSFSIENDQTRIELNKAEAGLKMDKFSIFIAYDNVDIGYTRFLGKLDRPLPEKGLLYAWYKYLGFVENAMRLGSSFSFKIEDIIYKPSINISIENKAWMPRIAFLQTLEMNKNFRLGLDVVYFPVSLYQSGTGMLYNHYCLFAFSTVMEADPICFSAELSCGSIPDGVSWIIAGPASTVIWWAAMDTSFFYSFNIGTLQLAPGISVSGIIPGLAGFSAYQIQILGGFKFRPVNKVQTWFLGGIIADSAEDVAAASPIWRITFKYAF